jgi:hypothetical protein
MSMSLNVVALGVDCLRGNPTGVVLVLGNRCIFKSIRELSDASARVAGGDYTPRLAIPKEREIGNCRNR